MKARKTTFLFLNEKEMKALIKGKPIHRKDVEQREIVIQKAQVSDYKEGKKNGKRRQLAR